MEITELQKLWLYSRGGRTVKDVIRINNNLYVAMRDKHRNVKIEIPTDRFIQEQYNTKKTRYYSPVPSKLILRNKQKTA